MAKSPAKAKDKEKKRGIRLGRVIWIVGLIGILFPALLFTLVSYGAFGPLPDTKKLEDIRTPVATEVISSDGVVLGKFFNENRSPVSYDELSPKLVNTLVKTEDVRFYDHSGVDFKRVFTIIFHTLTGNRQGASTLSQQLAKNLFPRKDMNMAQLVIRKLQEWVIAIQLERLYTKEEIITMYLNTVDFGGTSIVGIQSASKTFFNKKPSQLDYLESAVLVGMLKGPTLYNPVRNPKKSLDRRNTVLSQLLKYEEIDKKEFAALKEKPTVLHYTIESHNEGTATYFREYIRQIAQNWAKANGLDIYADGLRIYTTIDSRMQKYGEEALYNHMKELQKEFFKQSKTVKPWASAPEIIDLTMKRSERYRAMKDDEANDDEIKKAFNKPVKMKVFSYRGAVDTVMSPLDSIKYYKHYLHSGFMAMEPNTGNVKVWVGGVDYRFFKYDHCDSKAKRQVGSTFKPIVYATAVMNGYSPCQKFPNTPVVFEEYENWTPKNSDNEYGGEKTLQVGLAQSTNTITARVMMEVGIKPVVELAQNMGIKSKLDPVPSLCLGVADISIPEMVGAFNTINNYGEYVEPLVITRIEDRNGNVLQEFVPKSKVVLDDKKSYIMVEMLKGVANCKLAGTACRLRYRFDLRGPMGGKTGTTQNNSDGWFMGIIPQLTGGVWVGGEDRAIHFNSMNMGQGASMALPIWANFLKKAYADKALGLDPEKDWQRPAEDLGVVIDCAEYEQTTPDDDAGKEVFGGG